jgi:phosphoribosylformylglycinamidine cyclo-ligase
MFRTFNMGVGMVVVVAARDAGPAVQLFGKLGQKAWVIGDLAAGQKGVQII